MGFAVYDTMRRAVVVFESIEPGHVRMYTCGPTVHDHAHIGNMRTFLFEDLLRRVLRARGFAVDQVMNLTDVDDKIIDKARAAGVGIAEYTAPYKAAFFEDIDTLRIERAEHYPAATEHLDTMIDLVAQLEARGVTYRTEDGSIYFRIAAFPQYGDLSGVDLSNMRDGARVESDEYDKENPKDFALWKAAKPDEEAWETRLGYGRPGWHLECSAMSMAYLGESFDIHTGGVDNIFPHHENEIAQSRAATGRPLANYWLHAEHLIVEGKKMAKSLGNYLTLRDLIERGYRPRVIRYLLLSVHYRSQINFTFEGLDQAAAALGRLTDFVDRLGVLEPGRAPNAWVEARTEAALGAFNAALDEDLNSSRALGVCFEWVRDLNRAADDGQVTTADQAVITFFLDAFDQIYDVLTPDPDESEIDAEIEGLISARQAARAARDFALADEIRERLARRGVMLEDTADGVRWKRV